MSDLIRRKALLENIKGVPQLTNCIYPPDVYDLITNAPAVEQGEPVAEIRFDELGRGYAQLLNLESFDTKQSTIIHNPIPLYTAPPQPQTVKDALEKAAKICDDRAKYMQEMIMQYVEVGKAYTGAMVCADAIRALIEKE